MSNQINKDQVYGIRDSVNGILGDDMKTTVIISKNTVKSDKPFIMLFQEAVGYLLDGRLGKNGLRIFVYMLGTLEYSNHVGVNQETMAEDLGISLVYVKRGVKELVDGRLIISYKDPTDKRRNVYVINPTVAWKGKEKSRRKAISKHNENQLTLTYPEK